MVFSSSRDTAPLQKKAASKSITRGSEQKRNVSANVAPFHCACKWRGVGGGAGIVNAIGTSERWQMTNECSVRIQCFNVDEQPRRSRPTTMMQIWLSRFRLEASESFQSDALPPNRRCSWGADQKSWRHSLPDYFNPFSHLFSCTWAWAIVHQWAWDGGSERLDGPTVLVF